MQNIWRIWKISQESLDPTKIFLNSQNSLKIQKKKFKLSHLKKSILKDINEKKEDS